MSERCVSCGFRIADGEKQYYKSKTGEKVFFCRFCNSVFRQYITENYKENDDED